MRSHVNKHSDEQIKTDTGLRIRRITTTGTRAKFSFTRWIVCGIKKKKI